jgi:hypothetical protein
MRYFVVDPITGNQDFNAEAASPWHAANHWLACQRTWVLTDERGKERDLVLINEVGRRFALPIKKVGL